MGLQAEMAANYDEVAGQLSGRLKNGDIQVGLVRATKHPTRDSLFSLPLPASAYEGRDGLHRD